MMTKDQYRDIAQEVQGLRPDNTEAFKQLFFQFLFLSSGVYFSFQSFLLWLLGQMILGIFFWRSFVILHSCGHRSFTSSVLLDDITGIIHSVFCLIPFETWKDIHNDHHKWTGWIDLDPTTYSLTKRPGRFKLGLVDVAWKLWIPLISAHYILTIFYRFRSPSYRNLKMIKAMQA